MKKNWIHKGITDFVFILSPPFLCLSIIFLFQDEFSIFEKKYSFFNWLILIVFIDVAHVYSTLYKTYFNPNERKEKKSILVGLPILSLFFGIILYVIGEHFFWSILAYIAVYHFIRQQYGFMRLYAKTEKHKNSFLDNLSIYNATLFPMLYWFLSPNRNYVWFIENEFLSINSPELVQLLRVIYFSIIGIYILHIIIKGIKYKTINIQKLILIAGTYTTWYFGIVHFNNDLIFTLLNVVSHGVPYVALIYFNQNNEKHIKFLPKLSTSRGLLVFIVVILIFAFSEEFLWEYTVWNEHLQFHKFINPFKSWHWFLIPLLTVPQLTHYILDGIIWKRKNYL